MTTKPQPQTGKTGPDDFWTFQQRSNGNSYNKLKKTTHAGSIKCYPDVICLTLENNKAVWIHILCIWRIIYMENYVGRHTHLLLWLMALFSKDQNYRPSPCVIFFWKWFSSYVPPSYSSATEFIEVSMHHRITCNATLNNLAY